MGEMVQFKRPDGKIAPAIWQLQSRTGRARLCLYQEWWGLTIKSRELRTGLAEAGYRALVPDLYRGKVAKAADEPAT